MRDCDGVELAGNQQFALIANQTKGNTMSQSTIPPELALKIQDSQQSVGREPDGPGRRIGKVGEFTFIAPLKAGGAEKFRQRLAASQAQAGYYEGQLGTVHDLRIVLFDNDTRLLFAATYDSDFQPYVAATVGSRTHLRVRRADRLASTITTTALYRPPNSRSPAESERSVGPTP